jgi:hypothetical protein
MLDKNVQHTDNDPKPILSPRSLGMAAKAQALAQVRPRTFELRPHPQSPLSAQTAHGSLLD